ncbi:MAG: hypothetical protein JXR10_17125 [Cyclobacteriaceae bacterium]
MKHILYTSLFCICSLIGWSQSNVLKEEVTLQTSDDFLIVGETFYFSAFTNLPQTNEPSALSKILYIELVGEGGRPVIQQKIKLENGRGNGSFFVSSLLSTGTYQLLAYTRWMKNFGNYYRNKIVVVNPFEAYQPTTSDADSKLEFFTQGKNLVYSKPNLVVLKMTDGLGNPTTGKGKIVTESGDKICDFVIDSIGYGRINITPNPGSKYQAIVENQDGSFLFENLPAPKPEDSFIHVEKLPDGYRLHAHLVQDQTHQLIVTNGHESIFETDILSGLSVSIPNSKFSNGAFLALIKKDNKIITQRPFLHIDEKPSIEKPIVVEKRSLISIPVEFGTGAEFSVTVNKTNPEEPKKGELFGTVNSKLSQAYLLDFNLSWEQLDNQVIAENSWVGGFPDQSTTDVKYLPELRGELITGRMLSPANAKNSLVSFSKVGKNYRTHFGRVDSLGNFMIQQPILEGDYEGYLVLQMDSVVSASFEIESPFLTSYPTFDYSSPKLSEGQIKRIVEESLEIQLENAYYELLDSTNFENNNKQFGEYRSLYRLDDYNRFPKMHEHFIEFIPEVMARDNRFSKKIKPILMKPINNPKKPLILLDGVPVSDQEILDFSPFKIESIGVINNRVFAGPLVADGIVSFHTIDGDLQGFDITKNSVKVQYRGIESPTIFESPDYSNLKTNLRIPDYRRQLYWNPSFDTQIQDLEFHSGDSEGVYLLKIDGYDNGKAISYRQQIVVK